MAQLIVSLEDTTMLSEIKRAIGMLRGVVSVKETDGPMLGLSDGEQSCVNQSREEYAKGNFTTCSTKEELHSFLNSL